MSNNITVRQAREARLNLKKLIPANPKLDDDLEMIVRDHIL